MNPYLQYMYSYPHKTAYGPLTGVNLKDYGERLSGNGHGLYLHLPFCQTKCGYCNLFSVTGAKDEEIDRYLDGVERQVKEYRHVLKPFKTVFSDFTIGGGTPLLLTERQLERMFSLVNDQLCLEKDGEIVIETAPNQTDTEKLRLLQRWGVTRVSMGIQSFSETELKTLGRSHSGKKAQEALELLMSFGFPCVNIDFIYGIPGQSITSLLDSLKKGLKFHPQEIFLYPLYVKHGAGLIKKLKKGLVLELENAYLQYQEASAFLKAHGYRQDSMRRFVKYKRSFSDCGFGTSLALGCGGRSYVGNLHFCTPYAITRHDCIRELENFEAVRDFTVISHGIFLSKEEEKRRYVIRHLLIRPGLPIKRYRNCFGTEVLQDFPLISCWQEQGFVTMENETEEEYLTLTQKGLGLSDYLGPQLISTEIGERMTQWEMIHGQAHGSLPRQFKEL